jgi:type IV pilus assembly protein PilA
MRYFGWNPAVTGEEGVTLLQVMVVVAIVAILAAIAVPNFVTPVQQSAYQTTLEVGQSAIRALNLSAFQGQGAVLIQQGTSLTVSSNSGAQWSGQLPIHGQLQLNGQQLTCIAVNGMGIPDASAVNPPTGCTLSEPSTLQWSVQYANQPAIAITTSSSNGQAYD